jgi:uncharacterized protein (UPF0332 family)
MNELSKCFRKGLLRKVEPSKTKSIQSIQESEKWIKESIKNLDSGAYNSAQLSIYLIFFHAARAVLFRDGVREKSHYCIVIYLESYTTNNLLEESWVVLFDQMRRARHSQQYNFQPEPIEDEIISNLKSAEKFNKRIKKLLEETESQSFT